MTFQHLLKITTKHCPYKFTTTLHFGTYAYPVFRLDILLNGYDDLQFIDDATPQTLRLKVLHNEVFILKSWDSNQPKQCTQNEIWKNPKNKMHSLFLISLHLKPHSFTIKILHLLVIGYFQTLTSHFFHAFQQVLHKDCCKSSRCCHICQERISNELNSNSE